MEIEEKATRTLTLTMSDIHNLIKKEGIEIGSIPRTKITYIIDSRGDERQALEITWDIE